MIGLLLTPYPLSTIIGVMGLFLKISEMKMVDCGLLCWHTFLHQRNILLPSKLPVANPPILHPFNLNLHIKEI